MSLTPSPSPSQPDAAAPQLCFGQVRHTRLRQAQHAFGYRVFFMRLPLRSMAAAGPQANRPSHLFSRNQFNLLSFHDADHGDGQRPLLAWIDGLLRSEGISDADGEIWLQCFPRVLGYVFNPVSFWFCHRKNGELRAILCEVNNTFGERHCYLLDAGGAIAWGIELSARKVFHVSPFCAIEGSYRFRFMRATRMAKGSQVEQTVARVDHHDASGPLVLTSISGDSRPLSNGSAARALLAYPLMTIVIVARIHWQALQLWLKRVPFFSKPSPPTSEHSR